MLEFGGRLVTGSTHPGAPQQRGGCGRSVERWTDPSLSPPVHIHEGVSMTLQMNPGRRCEWCGDPFSFFEPEIKAAKNGEQVIYHRECVTNDVNKLDGKPDPETGLATW